MDRWQQLRAFLNPLNAVGGKLGRTVGPVLVMAVAASQVIPGTPLNLLGFTEFGGLDVSVYSGEVDQARWEQSGVAVAVIGGWHGGSANPYAEATLRNARAAGKITATYCYLNKDRDIAWQIDRCKEATGSEWSYLNFVAVDGEDRRDDGSHLSVAQILVGLNRAQEIGGRVVFYSGCWFVNGYLPRDEIIWLAPYPYWNAAYTVSGEFEGVQYNNCIPGARLMGEQYAGSGMWGAGQNIWSDKNVFDDMFIREGYPFSGASPLAPTPGVTLILLVDKPGLYAVVGGVRIWVPSVEVFDALGYHWEDVQTVDSSSPLWWLPALSIQN